MIRNDNCFAIIFYFFLLYNRLLIPLSPYLFIGVSIFLVVGELIMSVMFKRLLLFLRTTVSLRRVMIVAINLWSAWKYLVLFIVL